MNFFGLWKKKVKRIPVLRAGQWTKENQLVMAEFLECETGQRLIEHLACLQALQNFNACTEKVGISRDYLAGQGAGVGITRGYITGLGRKEQQLSDDFAFDNQTPTDAEIDEVLAGRVGNGGFFSETNLGG